MVSGPRIYILCGSPLEFVVLAFTNFGDSLVDISAQREST